MHDKLIIDRWAGRLCNNMTQLCNAIYLAEQTRSQLEVPKHDGWLQVQDFDFSEGAPCPNTIAGAFFELNEQDEVASQGSSPDWNERMRVLKQYVRPMLPENLFPERGEDELALHIRSGDVFNRAAKDTADGGAIGIAAITGPLLRLYRRLKLGHRAHPNFVQPPLSYYTQIIESHPWSRISIVAEDDENPVIPELLRRYDNVEFQPGDLKSDVTKLLAARHVVIGYGTFGIIWALLSDHIQSLYSPFVPALALGELRCDDIDDCAVHSYQFNNYIPIGQWDASDEQRQLMLTHPTSDVVEMGAQACATA